MTLFGYRVPPAYSLLIWIALWEVIGRMELAFILPPFSGVIEQLFVLIQRHDFQAAALQTLQSFIIGMAIAIVGGVALGFIMGRSRVADSILGMWVNIFASAPLSSLVPVLMLLFGLGQTTIIVTVVLFAIWIIALDTYAGVRHSPHRFRRWAIPSEPADGNSIPRFCSGRLCRRSSRASAWA